MISLSWVFRSPTGDVGEKYTRFANKSKYLFYAHITKIAIVLLVVIKYYLILAPNKRFIIRIEGLSSSTKAFFLSENLDTDRGVRKAL
jgi:hypothetical protein